MQTAISTENKGPRSGRMSEKTEFKNLMSVLLKGKRLNLITGVKMVALMCFGWSCGSLLRTDCPLTGDLIFSRFNNKISTVRYYPGIARSAKFHETTLHTGTGMVPVMYRYQ